MNASRRSLGLIFGVAVFAASTSIAAANISARINRVGLFAGSPQAVRSGVITFVEVDIRNTGSAPFEAVLRATPTDQDVDVAQTDRDGDVVVSELPIAVAPDGEWETKEIYFVPNMRNSDGRMTIKIYTPDGELVEFANDLGQPVKSLQSEPYFDRPDNDALLIVTMTSGGRVTHGAYLELANQGLNFTDPITARDVRGISPRELPKKSQGLDAVDALIWEDADPAEISPDQAQALIEWVEQGGRLLITVNSHWQSFHSSPLAEVLPASIDDVEDVRAIPAMQGIVVTLTEYEALAAGYKRQSVTRCRMRPRTDAIPIPSEVKPDQSSEDDKDDASQDLEPIAYRRYVGRGMITMLGARLIDLLPPPAVDNFDDSESANIVRVAYAGVVEKVVANNLLALPAFREAKGSVYGFETRRNLFSALTRTIGFSAVTGVFLFFAIAFTGVYTLVATLGSYVYLTKKGWAGHCWTAFTGVSLVGIVIGLGIVWMLRGFSTKVWQTSVVDARAGVNYGYATCLFGVKTKDHTRLDLQLPVGYANASSGNGELFALPRATDSMSSGESSFVASDTYALTQAGTGVEGAPVRATLKEFEGRWHGEIGGTLEAKLVIDRSGRITGDSFIRNELGITLSDCYIIEGNQEIAGERGRATGLRCHSIGRLAANGDDSTLTGEPLVDRIYVNKKAPPNADGSPAQRKGTELYLSTFVDNWRGGSGLGSIMGGTPSPANVATDAEHAPFLLLSVYNLIDPGSSNDPWSLQRSFGRRLDCSHWITKRTAVLIGFSLDDPPAILQIDRANERPERALTMYRFLIPVERE
ncbi:MAG: hypothetical protein H6818_13855 [Phycisphaerales bacterium]|nr:hypothetical protein [Phycisphaerales bacterium]MCB9862113.1 hypothetical protein [Phycisphaerales bacterium]